jgi:hypothetical protein
MVLRRHELRRTDVREPQSEWHPATPGVNRRRRRSAEQQDLRHGQRVGMRDADQR